MKRKFAKVTFRRRHEGKTDYKARATLLKSKEPRLIIRKTDKYIIAQIVKSKEAQDSTVCYANSKELGRLGWDLSFKNIPASYLTGLLIAKKAKEKGIKKAIIDIGLYRSIKGSKLYAVVKGALDGGLDIPHEEKMIPKEERIKGSHAKNAEKINKIFNEIREKLKG
ncbi:MAG: 50S ribosomal protein L18 [Candidatus Pacearchaeota archaeon]|nr:MAG: 50S ribosomal protein L18 [Candidatus Pacearchaeota archaeon]